MSDQNWMDSLPLSITVCDRDGKIIYMNDSSQQTLGKDSGTELIGKSLFDCHSPASNQMIHAMLASGDKNIYTIQKKGQKKLIYQTPFFENGEVAGLVEFSIVLPEDMPHHNRDASA